MDRGQLLKQLSRPRKTSHPSSFGADLIEAFASLPKLGNYAHLPMQSGSNKMLKSMNRPYTRERFLSIVHSLRSVNPNMRLSTDVIVGYPGEDDNDFKKTCSAFSEAAFEMGFIFKYSERSGTPAASMADKVPQVVKEQRNQILLEMLSTQSFQSNVKLKNSRMKVLVESKAKKGGGEVIGKTLCFRKVIFPAEESIVGKTVLVDIKEVDGTVLKGTVA